MRPLFLFLLGAAVLPAQPVSFGVKGGVPLNDFIDTVSSPGLSAFSQTKRFIVGPMFELHLPWGFSVEADALYRHFNYQIDSTRATPPGNSNASSNDWEFPILLKYRFASHAFVRPYVGAGVSFDTLQGLTETISTTVSSSTTSSPGELKNSTTIGGVIDAGLDMHFLFLHIEPELRYTRWTSQHLTFPNLLNSNQNQAEFLVGITF